MVDESHAWALLDEATRNLIELQNKVYVKYDNLPECKEKERLKNAFNEIVDMTQTNLDLLYPQRKNHKKAILRSIKYL